MARRRGLLLVLGCAAAGPAGAATVDPDGHWWPHSRGRVGSYGATTLLGPKNLKEQLAWSWEHPHLGITTGAILDKDKNIYASSMDGIRKFSPDGTALWHWWSIGEPKFGANNFHYVHSVPVIVDDRIYSSTSSCWMVCLDLATGKMIWGERHGEYSEMDTPYIEVRDGVAMQVFKRNDMLHQNVGNRNIVAVNASDGSKLWSYASDTTLWNFQPQFPGDGTFLTMDVHGAVGRFEIQTGKKLNWVQPEPVNWEWYPWTDGGLILGPEGKMAYTCSNLAPGMQNTAGILRAYSVPDMKQLWHRVLSQPCVSWPASDGKFVVVPTGGLPSSVPHYIAIRWIPELMKGVIHVVSNFLKDYHTLLWGQTPRSMYVEAFDATTGKPLWTFHRIKPWDRVCARGDEELFHDRFVTWYFRPVCGPASWSAPTISGDGTVYAAGMNGILYAIRDVNSDGAIDDWEVSTLDVGAASLHQGASFAPGMMTFSTCKGFHVFNT